MKHYESTQLFTISACIMANIAIADTLGISGTTQSSGLTEYAQNQVNTGDVVNKVPVQNKRIPYPSVYTLSQTKNKDSSNSNSNIGVLLAPEDGVPAHIFIGNMIRLQYTNRTVKSNEDVLVTIKDKKRLKLTYSDIIFMADEFVGSTNLQVSGRDSDVNIEAFKVDYRSMLENPDTKYIAPVDRVIGEEISSNESNILQHKRLVINEDTKVKLNCATGGGCSRYNYMSIPGLYLQLSTADFDNYGKYAIEAYMAGHTLALNTALAAKDDVDLKIAYSYEAYADHFLVNLFNSGQVRIPRKELLDFCELVPDAAMVLTKEMEEQDNKGLQFTSYSGYKWHVYSYKDFFTDKNEDNRRISLKIVQLSVDQVYTIFKEKQNSRITYMLQEMHKQLPDIDAIIIDKKNKPALFKVVDGQLSEYFPREDKYKSLNCWEAKTRYLASKEFNK